MDPDSGPLVCWSDPDPEKSLAISLGAQLKMSWYPLATDHDLHDRHPWWARFKKTRNFPLPASENMERLFSFSLLTFFKRNFIKY